MKVNYVRCREKDCETLMEASWIINGSMIALDSYFKMDTKGELQNKEPYTASHIALTVDLNEYNCPKCDHSFKKDKNYSMCLVNHGDKSACLSCPECNNYIEGIGLWHYTEWTETDLIEEEYKPLWMNSEDTRFYSSTLDISEAMQKSKDELHKKLKDLT